MKGCDTRGFLSLNLLWLLSKRSMYGQELAKEIEKRRGKKPQPGALYPALKALEKKALVKRKEEKNNGVKYELTAKGKRALKEAVSYFRKAFSEIMA